MSEMITDAAVLAAEAGNFSRIAAELKGVITSVEATAGALQPTFKGTAGMAAQAALLRYQEAGNAQERLLDDIANNIQQSGVQYTATDEDQSAAIQAVNMGL